MNGLSVFDHFVGMALKGLNTFQTNVRFIMLNMETIVQMRSRKSFVDSS